MTSNETLHGSHLYRGKMPSAAIMNLHLESVPLPSIFSIQALN